jgi:putative selenate reductase
MNLVGRFREELGSRVPISFSAGVDRVNFPDAVALGLVPVTVCTDLLRPGGYARSATYGQGLGKRMREVGARSIDEFVIRAYGRGEEALAAAGVSPGSPEHAAAVAALAGGGDLAAVVGETVYRRWVAESTVANTKVYVERATADPRYRQARNSKLPKKIGSQLTLFDCITCDKCIPVCPNAANFTFFVPRARVPVVTARREGDAWVCETGEPISVEQKHQIANFADFCNDCGNCDVFCPEDGGPYVMKPRFFGSLDAFHASAPLDGFHLECRGDTRMVNGRFQGRDFRVEIRGGHARYAGDGFSVTFDRDDPEGTLDGNADGAVDLTYFRLMNLLSEAIYAEPGTNHVSALAIEDRPS